MKYLLLLLLCGCALTPLQADRMTPDQIKAYSDANEDVYLCGSVLGPPPNGAVMFLVVPKGAAMNIQLSPTCQIQQGTLSSGK